MTEKVVVSALSPRNMTKRQRHVVLKNELNWSGHVNEHLSTSNSQAVLDFKLEYSLQILGKREWNVDLMRTLLLAVEEEIKDIQP